MDAPPVQYVTTSDGYSIAYAVAGEGRPVVLLPRAFSHVQLNWTEDTLVRPLLKELAARYRLIQYDGRGQGMSTRGLRSSHSMIDHVRDLETVLDASGIERCVLIARTVFGHAAVRYAVEHPERVDALVLVSVPVSGSSLTSIFTVAAQKSWDLLLAVAASTELTADRAGARWRLMQTINLDDYVVMVGSWLDSDIGDLLHRVEVPTLVLHPRDYLLRSPDEAMKVAAGIPSARFRLLEGSQPYGEVSEIVTALDSFLADLPARRARAVSDSSAVGSSVGIPGSLSVREVEVLKLLAAGRSNQQIAGELVISLNTVNRHVSNIYAKTGAANRAEAVSWAYRRGLA